MIYLACLAAEAGQLPPPRRSERGSHSSTAGRQAGSNSTVPSVSLPGLHLRLLCPSRQPQVSLEESRWATRLPRCFCCPTSSASEAPQLGNCWMLQLAPASSSERLFGHRGPPWLGAHVCLHSWARMGAAVWLVLLSP